MLFLLRKIIRRYINRIEAYVTGLRYGFPARNLKIIGVTGTDGKTTTANLIYWILKNSGKKVGLISTVSAKIGDKDYDTGFHVTTSDSHVIQRFLADMVKIDCEFAVFEVTSHGLEQERVALIKFEIGVLTNLTHEHLDYHKTMDNYAKSKAKLFNRSKLAILNKDDENFGLIDKLIHKNIKKLFYNKETISGVVRKTAQERFGEPYNLMNATAAILVARKLGIKDEIIVKAIETFPGVSGRMEEIENSRGLKIFVDFAHTPNALESVLKALKSKKSKKSKLIVVFGCAGERDREKRPMMVEIATRIADFSVFTTEDPRSESVEDILDEMEKGVVNRNFVRILDRGKAINYSINKLAKKGDVVVICGKGHEKSMNFGGEEVPWSDIEEVRKILGK